MRSNNPASCDHVRRLSRKKCARRLLACFPGLASVAVVLSMLAAVSGMWASTAPTPANLTVQRSTRATPRRYAIHPNGATVEVNQTQRFAVTDADGKPVAVRWNVSGLGCSGATCGTIDDQGVYRTPSSLPHPRIVILEGVLINNPKYSVLTEIRLESTANVSASSALPSVVRPRPLEPPALPSLTTARRADQLPLPNAVTAAPGSQDLISSLRIKATLPQEVVAASPAVERWDVPRGTMSPAPPRPVGVAPSVEKWGVARDLQSPPPHIVGAAPVVTELSVAPRVTPPSPQIIAAAPTVEKWDVARKLEPTVLPPAIAATPATSELNGVQRAEHSLAQQIIPAPPPAEKWNVTRDIEPPLPQAIAAVPVIRNSKMGPRVDVSLAQQVVSAAPTTEKWDSPRSVERPSLRAVTAAPGVRDLNRAPRTDHQLSQQIIPAAPAAEKWEVARNLESPLQPRPVAAAPAEHELNHAPRADHQLTQQIVPAAPVPEKWEVARNLESPPQPQPVAAAPAEQELNHAPRADHQLAQQIIPAAPVPEKWEVARSVQPLPLTVGAVQTPSLAATARQNPSANVLLLPLPVEGGAAPGTTPPAAEKRSRGHLSKRPAHHQRGEYDPGRLAQVGRGRRPGQSLTSRPEAGLNTLSSTVVPAAQTMC